MNLKPGDCAVTNLGTGFVIEFEDYILLGSGWLVSVESFKMIRVIND